MLCVVYPGVRRFAAGDKATSCTIVPVGAWERKNVHGSRFDQPIPWMTACMAHEECEGCVTRCRDACSCAHQYLLPGPISIFTTAWNRQVMEIDETPTNTTPNQILVQTPPSAVFPSDLNNRENAPSSYHNYEFDVDPDVFSSFPIRLPSPVRRRAL